MAALAYRVPVLHDISSGGLAVALAEICIASGVGASIEVSAVEELFSEDPHRVIAVVEPGAEMPVFSRLVGRVGGDRISLGDYSVPLAEASEAWSGAITRSLAR